MKLSRFTLLLTLAILMVIGCALIPRIDVADKPRPTQGKTLNVWYSWNGASAKVIEQKDLTDDLIVDTMKEMIHDPERLRELETNAAACRISDTADRIYEVIQRAVKT